MAIQLQLRRGTTAENDAFTGAVAEVTVDTDTHELRVHDGATEGGFTVASKADMTTALSGKADVATTLAGYGITDGANTDMDNLTDTGKNISNWSSNVTNCIVSVAQDIKLELNTSSHVLTLKAGSKLYIPNGFEEDGTTPKFDVITTESDFSVSDSQTRTLWVGYDVVHSRLIFATNSETGTPSVATYKYYYDPTANKCYCSTASEYPQASFPVAIVKSVSGTGIKTIDQVFNGFGYIGNSVFVLPNMTCMSCNGKNTDGTLKNRTWTTDSVKVITAGSTMSGAKRFVINAANNLYVVEFDTWVYKQELNLWERTSDGAHTELIDLTSAIEFESGRIINFKKVQPFHAVDYSDTPFIAHQAMPSDRYIDLSSGITSGQSFTAPADGYVFISADSTATGQRVLLYSLLNVFASGQWSSNSGQALKAFLPIRQGDVFTVVFTAPNNLMLRFFYLQGAQ